MEPIVHRTVSPAEAFVVASVRKPPVIVVLQSTNPTSPWPGVPQGGAAFPIWTSKIAAMVQEVPRSSRLSIINAMKKNFLVISTHLLCV